MKKVAVVILNWNGRKLLEQFLPSVVRNTTRPEVDIIVADNASSDDSLQFVQQNYPEIRLIQLDENYGFAKGYNLALKQVEAEYFVLLNSDVELTPNWLKPLLDYMELNKSVIVAQPKILKYRQPSYFEYAGASGGFIDKLGFPFCRGRIFDTLEQDTGQYNAVREIFWASGACMMVRGHDFLNVGGFDDRFFAHMEEIDLCWRIKARGGRVVAIPQSIVYHVGGATLSEGSEQKVYLNFRNNMLLLYKNSEAKRLKKLMPIRKTYNLIAAFKFLLSGEFKKFNAVWRAHRDYNKMKGSYERIRHSNMEETLFFDIPEMYKGNITLDYYLRRKKHFSDIFSDALL